MSYTEQETQDFEDSVESIYCESSISVNNLNIPNLFNKTIKYGMAVGVPTGQTAESTKKWAMGQIDYELRNRYDSLVKGYKKEGL